MKNANSREIRADLTQSGRTARPDAGLETGIDGLCAAFVATAQVPKVLMHSVRTIMPLNRGGPLTPCASCEASSAPQPNACKRLQSAAEEGIHC